MLENIGRRYLVEHTEADDGSWWADRYSDGWVVQGGKCNADGISNFTVVLPISYKDTNYFPFCVLNNQNDPSAGMMGVTLQPTQFICRSVNAGGSASSGNRIWIAQGYAA